MRSSEDPAERGFAVAVSLLARRDHSEAGLKEKLLAKGYAPDVVQRVVDRLRQRGYLDDRRVARALVRRHLSRGSAVGFVLARKLADAGIPDEIAREVMEEEGTDRGELARRLVLRRYPEAVACGDPSERRRAVGFLLRRGFSSSEISHALERGGEYDDDR